MTPEVMMTAMRLGFVEFRRFAAQYRRRYGEVPSEAPGRVRGLPLRVTESDRHGTHVTGPTRRVGGRTDGNGSADRM